MILKPTGPTLMMSLWGIAVLAWASTIAMVVHAHQATAFNRSLPIASGDTIMMYDPTALNQASDSVIAADLFRVERRPTQIAFGTPMVAGPAPTAPPRPVLVFGGIIGGPPWRAILNGVPNHDGSLVVATGDTAGGLRVRAIRRDTVIVQGRDTLWTFTVKH